jgi:hypothetical protein
MHYTMKGYRHLMNLFYEEPESWNLPFDKFTETLDELSKAES